MVPGPDVGFGGDNEVVILREGEGVVRLDGRRARMLCDSDGRHEGVVDMRGWATAWVLINCGVWQTTQHTTQGVVTVRGAGGEANRDPPDVIRACLPATLHSDDIAHPSSGFANCPTATHESKACRIARNLITRASIASYFSHYPTSYQVAPRVLGGCCSIGSAVKPSARRFAASLPSRLLHLGWGHASD